MRNFFCVCKRNSIAFAGCDWAVGICEAAVCAHLTHVWIKLHIDSRHVDECIRKLDLHARQTIDVRGA